MYSIRQFMDAIAIGQEITPQMKDFAEKYLLKQEEQERKRAIRRFEHQKAFAEELYDILSTYRNQGFTATDMQFMKQDFIERRIPCQKISYYLWYMTLGYFGADLRIKCYTVRIRGKEYDLYCVGDYEKANNKRYCKGKVHVHYINSRPASPSEFLD